MRTYDPIYIGQRKKELEKRLQLLDNHTYIGKNNPLFVEIEWASEKNNEKEVIVTPVEKTIENLQVFSEGKDKTLAKVRVNARSDDFPSSRIVLNDQPYEIYKRPI